MVVAVMFVGVVALKASKASAESDCTITSTLKLGSKGAQVKCLQNALGISPATGYFGKKTRAAVRAFQTSNDITPVSGIFGPLSRAVWLASLETPEVPAAPAAPEAPSASLCPNGMTLASNCATAPGATPPAATTGPVSVMLATTSPATGTIIAGQAAAELTQFTFTGTGTVSSVTLTRGGISDQSTLTDVYLFDGATRLTDGYSFNSAGVLTMNNINLAVTGSRTISVRGDVLAPGTSYSISVTLSSYTAGNLVHTVSIKGNEMSIATGSNLLATANLTSTSPSPAAATISAGSVNQNLWSNTVNVGLRAAHLVGMTVKQIGSAPSNTLSNVSLFVDGMKVSSATINSNNQFTFNFSTSPFSLAIGSRLIEVRGDVVGGASRNFYLSLEKSADLMIKDGQVSGGTISITSTHLGGTLNNVLGGLVNISQGTLTITQDTAFNNTTTLVGGATNVKMSAFKFTSYGEDVKISSLTFTTAITNTNATAVATVSAVTAGSAALTSTVTGAAVTGVTSLVGGAGYSSAPTVTIQAPGVVSITSTTGATTNGATALTIAFTGGSCAIQPTATAVIASGLVSSVTLLTPGIGCATVPTAGLTWTGAAPTTLPVITPTLGTQAVATAVLTNGVVTSITIGTAGTGYGSVPTFGLGTATGNQTLANVGLYVNGGQVGSNVPVTSGTNTTFSSLGSNLTATVGTPVIVEIRGDVTSSTGISHSVGTINFGLVTGSNNAQGVTSSQLTNTPSSGGQTLTLGTGSIVFAQTSGWSGSTIAPNQAAKKIGSFTLSTGSAEGITINNILVGITGTMITNNQVTNITIKDGSTVIGTPIGNPTASNNFSVTLPVSMSSTKTLDVFADIGSGAATFTVIPTMTITYRGSTSNVTTNSLPQLGSTISANVAVIAVGGVTFVPSSSASAQFLIGGQPAVTIGTFNFVSNGVGGGVIKDVTVTVPANTIGSVTMNGVSGQVVNTTATLYNVNVTIPADPSGINIPITVSLVCVSAPGQGCGGLSNSITTASITNVTYNNGSTTVSVIPTSAITVSHRLVASRPTVAMTASAGGVGSLVNGSQQVGTFTVSADLAGDIKLEAIPVVVNLTTTTISAGTLELRDSTGTTVLVGTGGVNGTSGLSASGTFLLNTSFRTITKGTSETFTVYATYASVTTGASASFGLGAKASLLWTDTVGAVGGITGGLITYPMPVLQSKVF